MAIHYNSASRLLTIVERFLRVQDNTSVMEAWSGIFNIAPGVGYARPFLVAERLCVLHEELERMELSLKDSSYGEDLYAQPIATARRVFSPEYLSATNNQLRLWLSSEVQTPFRYMVPGLPSDTKEFSDEDLLELNTLIAKLEDVIASSTADAAIIQIVRNHMALLLRALAIYPIRGPLALSEALRLMAVELYYTTSVLEEYRDTPEVGLLHQTVNQVKRMVATASASDVIAVVTLAFDAGKKALGG